MNKYLAITLLTFLTACSPAVVEQEAPIQETPTEQMPVEEVQTEPGHLEVRDIEGGSQLVLIQADGSEKVLDEGKTYKEDDSVDVREIRSFKQIETNGNFAFVEVAFWEYLSVDLYDLETGEKLKTFGFAQTVGFIPGKELAYACANASAYGRYYAEVIDLKTQASKVLFSEDQNTAPAVAYTTNLECRVDSGEIKATVTNAEAKETVYTYAI